ncbi:aspartate aminotransferase family protein [Thermoactinomyces sp. CICC 10522]|uniref:aspartate aminotransferase family protein n=1 Tax=Thermoactinomyces sp. CICC 10522 TaxID=2767427 RepID=UPI0018DBEB2F|nr:acetylornithine/succinylornithine family transaminase [Thermoactinomyces sp. CICC 10522]MBH8604118.1 acetylornithine/succinylornithine family transaminase [Thermoactinomyces sp. CICC 10522]
MSLFPTYVRHNVRFLKGNGAVLEDDQGKTYLDFASGIGVTNLGHNHPRIKQALLDQAEAVWHTSNLFQVPAQEKAAQRLTRLTGLGAVFFCNSGAEANEAAIKLARKWAQEAKVISEPEIITFQGSFHGRTLATLTATGQDKVKHGFSPLPRGFRTVPFGDLEAVKQATGATTAAVLLELVQGEGGVRPADPDFIEGLSAWCKEKEILLMVDEVQTGIGRTGAAFAFQTYGLKPDVITAAKGLGNGFPIGAMIAREELKPVLGPGTHGTTFGGNPLATAVAAAVLAELEETPILEETKAKGELFARLLTDELSGLPGMVSVRVKGLMAGVEFDQPVAPIITALLGKGLVTLPAGEKVLRLLPPLIVTEDQIRRAVHLIKQTCLERFEPAGSGR